jgi:hypothetical protein
VNAACATRTSAQDQLCVGEFDIGKHVARSTIPELIHRDDGQRPAVHHGTPFDPHYQLPRFDRVRGTRQYQF